MNGSQRVKRRISEEYLELQSQMEEEGAMNFEVEYFDDASNGESQQGETSGQYNNYDDFGVSNLLVEMEEQQEQDGLQYNQGRSNDLSYEEEVEPTSKRLKKKFVPYRSDAPEQVSAPQALTTNSKLRIVSAVSKGKVPKIASADDYGALVAENKRLKFMVTKFMEEADTIQRMMRKWNYLFKQFSVGKPLPKQSAMEKTVQDEPVARVVESQPSKMARVTETLKRSLGPTGGARANATRFKRVQPVVKPSSTAHQTQQIVTAQAVKKSDSPMLPDTSFPIRSCDDLKIFEANLRMKVYYSFSQKHLIELCRASKSPSEQCLNHVLETTLSKDVYKYLICPMSPIGKRLVTKKYPTLISLITSTAVILSPRLKNEHLEESIEGLICKHLGMMRHKKRVLNYELSQCRDDSSGSEADEAAATPRAALAAALAKQQLTTISHRRSRRSRKTVDYGDDNDDEPEEPPAVFAFINDVAPKTEPEDVKPTFQAVEVSDESN